MIYHIDRKNGLPVYDGRGLPKITAQLTRSSKSVGIIPELAIHLDPEKNKNGEVDPESMLRVIAGIDSSEGPNVNLADLWHELGASAEVDGFDLYLAPYQEHLVVGLDNDLIAGPRHDDLAMVYATFWPNSRGS